mmetsp:Transcript_53048/g.112695  ORF Transcript_53048/g.112695 Transcript_53048/m.112695 type:complete len:279 (+) Transcript_53048:165-1001(+)
MEEDGVACVVLLPRARGVRSRLARRGHLDGRVGGQLLPIIGEARRPSRGANAHLRAKPGGGAEVGRRRLEGERVGLRPGRAGALRRSRRGGRARGVRERVPVPGGCGRGRVPGGGSEEGAEADRGPRVEAAVIGVGRWNGTMGGRIRGRTFRRGRADVAHVPPGGGPIESARLEREIADTSPRCDGVDSYSHLIRLGWEVRGRNALVSTLTRLSPTLTISSSSFLRSWAGTNNYRQRPKSTVTFPTRAAVSAQHAGRTTFRKLESFIFRHSFWPIVLT